jgi:hypothetical protein
MPKSVMVPLEIPGELDMLEMPAALQDRLQELLDRQDRDGKLTRREKREATALVDLAQRLSILRVRAYLVERKRGA